MRLEVDIQKKLGDFVLDCHFMADSFFTGLLGPSGCGKSMSLKCIAGIEKPDRGRITLDGKVLFDSNLGINVIPQKRRIGYLFQNYALFPTMDARKNILEGLRFVKDKNDREERFRKIVGMLKIEGILDLRPRQLSGGQMQRVALARMLANDPELILLDEPFSALDAHLRDNLMPEFIDLLSSYHKQVVLVTHSRDEAYRMCGRICLMNNGKVEREGKTEDVFNSPGTIASALITGCKNIAAARKSGSNKVFVPSWNITFTFPYDIVEDFDAVGIRAHLFSREIEENSMKVEVVKSFSEPFETTYMFRYEGMPESSPLLWYRTRDKEGCGEIGKLGVRHTDIMLLRSR